MEKEANWIFGEERNPEIPVNKSDYIKNLGIDTIDLNSASHIISVGKTKSGKSSMINRLICCHFLHHIPAENIIIFSPTFQTDKSFARLWWTLKKILESKKMGPKKLDPLKLLGGSEELKNNFYDDIDLTILMDIVKK